MVGSQTQTFLLSLSDRVFGTALIWGHTHLTLLCITTAIAILQAQLELYWYSGSVREPTVHIILSTLLQTNQRIDPRPLYDWYRAQTTASNW